MKLLVTGASGFLGRYVVNDGLGRGHSVRAMIRPATRCRSMIWTDHPRVEIVRVDLRSKRELVDALRGIDVVIHAAATKSGDSHAILTGTLVATENLLGAMIEAQVRRIVLVSSFAVYDYLRLPSFTELNESSPLESRPQERDAYCQSKLAQEELVLKCAERNGWEWTIVRPGAVYGQEEQWTARLGIKGSRSWVRLGAWALVPLTYVENCAEAIVLAAETRGAVGQVLNIVDDELPRQRTYFSELHRRTIPRPRVLRIPWTMLRLMARCSWLTNRLIFNGRVRLPYMLVPAKLHALAKPLRYPNRRMKEATGWQPRFSPDEALRRCFQSDSLMQSE